MGMNRMEKIVWGRGGETNREDAIFEALSEGSTYLKIPRS